MRGSYIVLVVGLIACTKDPRPPPPPGFAGPSPAQHLPIGTGTYGTASPTIVRAFDLASSRWMVLCQARADSDGDGKISIFVGHHGGVSGDELHPYLVLGGGNGTLIDAFVGRSADQRWIAVVRAGKLELVDATDGGAFPLSDADVESDDRPGASHRAGMFGDGRFVYVRHREPADVLVVHDLATHAERELAVADRLWRVGLVAKPARIYTVARDAGFPKLQTTLSPGECTGAFLSYSTYGQTGPEPKERWIDLDSGAELPAPSSPPTAPEHATPTHHPELTDGDQQGPAHWSP